MSALSGEYAAGVVVDYGGGNGDYEIIVIAPSTVQECIDYTYKAFYLAHKYRNPVILLADGLLGQMMEPACFGDYPYPEIDNSSWALTGAKNREARAIYSLGPVERKQIERIERIFQKFELNAENETDWEEFQTDDADIILTAFGSMTRNIKAAMKVLREKGIKAGYFRPITLSPFPNKRIHELAKQGKNFVVVEMNMGQMFKDVTYSVEGASKVSLIIRPVGEWLRVEEIVSGVEKIMEKSYAASI
jgi:2-oxoglutarate ferredoxin oxidoreductase subunit alpha